MRERPILFKGEMVRAILEGRKTQTRRLPRFTPSGRVKEVGGHREWHPGDPDAFHACPYGLPGDRLWVKETFALSCRDPEALERDPKDPADWDDAVYRADAEVLGEWEHYDEDGTWTRISPPWKPSIHMPRWASRITLDVTGVRLERLQDISEEDILSEGVDVARVSEWTGVPWSSMPTLHDAWRVLWDSINRKRAPWASNPYVWVIEFARAP